MTTRGQGAKGALAEYVLDGLGTSFEVILHNAVERRVAEKGPEVFIPDYQGLIKQIAISRSFHPAKLRGGDIRFLRKTLGMKAKELAAKLDISPEHLSRCEQGSKVLSPNSEKVLRSIVLLEAIYVAKKALEDVDRKGRGPVIDGLLKKLTDLLDKTKAVMEDLEIKPISSLEDRIVFHFHLVSSITPERANDDDVDSPREWSDAA
jgi:transcriptional regulator with XRE-family HTH domain